MAHKKESSKKQKFVEVGNHLNNFKSELINQRILISQAIIELNDKIKELRREVTAISTGFGAMVNLIADITELQPNVISQRLSLLIQEHSIVDHNGTVRGSFEVFKYNFET
jgi:hypothetical protein